ncbi:MAG: trypsin-like peptidase domain-containing protein, partial [Deltaproteobacteria bacterium]|nr:trypsin-like peptidase domain-containing protein [Deltaproteobacteria bacterium]
MYVRSRKLPALRPAAVLFSLISLSVSSFAGGPSIYSTSFVEIGPNQARTAGSLYEKGRVLLEEALKKAEEYKQSQNKADRKSAREILKKSREHFKKALKLDSTNVKYEIAIAESYYIESVYDISNGFKAASKILNRLDQQYPNRPEVIFPMALVYCAVGKHAESVQLFSRWLILNDKADSNLPSTERERCEGALREARIQAAEVLTQRAISHPPEDLEGKKGLLSKALALNPNSELASWELTATDQRINQIREEVRGAIAVAREGDIPTAKSVLATYNQYSKLVPEIEDLEKEIKISEHLRAAQQLSREGKMVDALGETDKALQVGRNHEVARSLDSQIRISYSRQLDSTATKYEAAGTLADLEKAVESLKEAREILPQDKYFEDRWHTVLNKLLRICSKHVEEYQKLETKQAKRISLEVCQRCAKSLDADEMKRAVTELRSATLPAARVRIVVIPQEASCFSAPDIEGLMESLSPSYINGLEFVQTMNHSLQSDSDFEVAIEFECHLTDLPETNVKRQNSTYVSTYLQVPNPAYVEKLSELIQAKADLAKAEKQVAYYDALLALNPYNQTAQQQRGYWAALVFGYSIRIIELQAELKNLSPYTRQPVTESYSYERFESYRSVEVSANVTVVDLVDRGAINQMKLNKSTESRSLGVRGVLSSDQNGLTNIEPNLESKADLEGQAKEKLVQEIVRAIRESIPRGFIRRAARAHSRKETINLLGNLIYAIDLSEGVLPESETKPIKDLISTATIKSPSQLQLEGVEVGQLLAGFIEEASPGTPVGSTGALELESLLPGVVMVQVEGRKGAGFFMTRDGLVMTNYHVIQDASLIIVKTWKSDVFIADIVSVDKDKDLALLRVQATDCHPLSLGDSSLSKLGSDVYTIGHPGPGTSLEATVTKGIISGLRYLDSITFIQTDAPINPGNSGGPLVD